MLLMSGLIGGIVAWDLMPVASRCHILYVSQDEIMEQEKKRIAGFKPDERELFFGKITEAVALAAESAKSYESGDSKVIYSSGKVSGSNVRSISHQVHKKIIDRLKLEENISDADKK